MSLCDNSSNYHIKMKLEATRAVNVYPGTHLTEGWYLNGS